MRSFTTTFFCSWHTDVLAGLRPDPTDIIMDLKTGDWYLAGLRLVIEPFRELDNTGGRTWYMRESPMDRWRELSHDADDATPPFPAAQLEAEMAYLNSDPLELHLLRSIAEERFMEYVERVETTYDYKPWGIAFPLQTDVNRCAEDLAFLSLRFNGSFTLAEATP